MHMRYYVVCSGIYIATTAFGMMKEAPLTPHRGELVLQEELPALLLSTLWEPSYRTFVMRRHNYHIDKEEKVVAIEGGFPSRVKIFEHTHGSLNETQEIEYSFRPVLDDSGTALAVVKKHNDMARHLAYYRRLERNGAFEHKSDIILDHIIHAVAFSPQGTLMVTLFLKTDTYETKEFVEETDHTLVPKKNLLQKFLEVLSE